MNETAVHCTLRKWEKASNARDTKNGGHRGAKSTYGASEHIKVVISASAAGPLPPPFFITAGKRKSSDWYSPVTGSYNEAPRGIIEPYTKPNWFPTHGCIKVTENRSTEGPYSIFSWNTCRKRQSNTLVMKKRWFCSWMDNFHVNTPRGLISALKIK